MFYKLISSVILALVVLGQGASSAPQTSSNVCGGPADPPCPDGEFCCKLATFPPRPTGL
ncbi:hypothetical protein B0H11DRAFT_2254251 [Mycena galericulata]|nr:hypothetical protein B0H11DRAFT_2254251 [Mycena galericulata]